MANIYDMPRLRLLCVNRLARELDVEHAATIWERAATAGEEWLKQRAAAFCLQRFGHIVRTAAFKSLPAASLIELCNEATIESRIVGAEELEILGQSRFAAGNRKRSLGSAGVLTAGEEDVDDDVEDDGMDVN